MAKRPSENPMVFSDGLSIWRHHYECGGVCYPFGNILPINLYRLSKIKTKYLCFVAIKQHKFSGMADK
jgi:hypothetical protein